jgi:Fe-S cluster biogenesis protein NfuA
MNDFVERANTVFARSVRPMTADGGGAKIVDIDENKKKLTLEMISTCTYCPNSQRSANALIKRIREHLDDVSEIRVIIAEKIAAQWPKE